MNHLKYNHDKQPNTTKHTYIAVGHRNVTPRDVGQFGLSPILVEISNFLLSNFYLDSRQISLKYWSISLAFVVFTTADVLQYTRNLLGQNQSCHVGADITDLPNRVAY